MKFLIELCGSFNPILILTVGCTGIFFFLYNTLHNINEGRKATKGQRFNNHIKTTGIIIDYEKITETKVIKENGVKRPLITEYNVPIIQYEFDNEFRQMTYKTYFFKNTPPNLGYEVAVYIDRQTQIPTVKYDDIYCNEIKDTEKTTYIVCGIIGVLTIVTMIFSIISNFS